MRLWRRMTVLAVDLWFVLALVRMVAGPRDHFVRDVGLLFFVTAAIVGALGLGMVVAARRRCYDIHRHGLAVRGPRGELEAIIPWARVDPGRILLRTPPRQVEAWTPGGLLDWAARPTFVLISGWERRSTDSCDNGAPRTTEATGCPPGWWHLGVTDPVNLLTVLESAMIADGHAARGLTVSALSHR